MCIVHNLEYVSNTQVVVMELRAEDSPVTLINNNNDATLLAEYENIDSLDVIRPSAIELFHFFFSFLHRDLCSAITVVEWTSSDHGEN
jgi:hypothetical protein